ncbi:integrating conjugative element protein [Lampropedia puyangensis]|uniref:Integrating conjugative element protein n=1 Tax=Lampropedia puyangensis TaxID=1330072 RepID=A0A4S8EZY9_9BURK|nr:integrating conjugative element protein [Lampropedia puyangensis]THT98411.1 integrating conjugative element protein [Lampropedia puyangensis]
MNTPFRNHIVAACTLACVLSLAVAPRSADAQPVSNSSLYYRLGGDSPANLALNPNMTAMKMGLNGAVKMNYSCGKFDIGLSWASLMNSLENLGATVTGAVQAGISALPLYILQRAHPGLYQLFQNFSVKADTLVAASLKSCEEMEQMILAGGNPYEDYVKMAKGEGWKAQANAEGNVTTAKTDMNKREFAQKRGVTWVYGSLAGGEGQPPIEPVKDITIAGFNATLNQPITASPTTDYSNGPHGIQRMVRAFRSAYQASQFTTEVLGDKAVNLNEDTPTTTSTAGGLGPKIEKELLELQPKLISAVQQPETVTLEKLNVISAPGMGITPQLMESIKRMPPDTQSMVIGRLSEELAIQRVVDKALIARNILITGLSLPEVQAASEATKDVQVKIDRLTQYIDDLLYEFRIRKEMSSATATAILEHQIDLDSAAASVPGAQFSDPHPIRNGRVAQ